MSNPTDKASVAMPEDPPIEVIRAMYESNPGAINVGMASAYTAARNALAALSPTPTDKASVAALDERHANQLLRDVENNRFPFNELMMHERNTLSAAIRRALSPAQGDGMRDALVKARAFISENSGCIYRTTDPEVFELICSLDTSLASYPDRQPGMTDEWVEIEKAPGNVEGMVWVADAGNAYRKIAFGGVREHMIDGAPYRYPWAEGYSGDWKITHWRPTPTEPAAIKRASQRQ